MNGKQAKALRRLQATKANKKEWKTFPQVKKAFLRRLAEKFPHQFTIDEGVRE